jgi:hypothetical protein
MDEVARKDRQTSLDCAIARLEKSSYAIYDARGIPVFIADNVIDLYLYVGSRLEH